VKPGLPVALLAAAALAPAGPHLLAQQRTVTLTEAIELAERVNPTVVQARGSVRSAGAGVRSAWGSFLPTLSAGSSFGYSFAETPSRLDPVTGELLPGGTSSTGVSFSAQTGIDLFTGFRRGAQLSAARAEERGADAAYNQQRWQQAVLGTTSAFLEALQATELVRARQAEVRRAEEQRAIAIARLITRVQGAVSDSLQAEVALGQARLRLLNEQNRLAGAEAALARLVGLDGRVRAAADSALFGTRSVVDTAVLLQDALERSPAVLQSEAQAEAARAQIGVARAGYFPSLRLSASTSYSGNDRNRYTYYNNRSLNLGFAWQLFNGFDRERNLVTQQVAYESALARAADARRDVGARLTTQLATFATAEERIRLATASRAAAEANVRVQTERYRLGSATIVELGTAQDALTRAEEEFVNARFDYVRARAQIEAILGRPL
jgi:outer membrane protein